MVAPSLSRCGNLHRVAVAPSLHPPFLVQWVPHRVASAPRIYPASSCSQRWWGVLLSWSALVVGPLHRWKQAPALAPPRALIIQSAPATHPTSSGS